MTSNLDELYAIHVRKLKQLHQNQASKSELRCAAAYLRELKRTLRRERLKSKQTRKVAQPCLKTVYPVPVSLPTDEAGFVLAFSLSCSDDFENERAKKFYEDFGFVIFRDILDSGECEISRNEIWDDLEHKYPGFSRSAKRSFSLLSSQTYGLSKDPAVFTPQMLRNRCNASLVKAMKLLIADEDILMSHDRWCFYRPTKRVDMDDLSVDMPEWRTSGGLHLDLNPWAYFTENKSVDSLCYKNLRDFSKEMNSVVESTGPHLQGVLALTDNTLLDGGTVLVPGFHKVFSSWVQRLGPLENYIQHNTSVCNRLVWRGHGLGSFKFCETDPIHDLKRRITIRAGSLLLWDQRLVHGSVPNDSENYRMAQFVKAFRAKTCTGARLAARTAAIRSNIDEDFIKTISIESRKVLGIQDC